MITHSYTYTLTNKYTQSHAPTHTHTIFSKLYVTHMRTHAFTQMHILYANEHLHLYTHVKK